MQLITSVMKAIFLADTPDTVHYDIKHGICLLIVCDYENKLIRNIQITESIQPKKIHTLNVPTGNKTLAIDKRPIFSKVKSELFFFYMLFR